MSDSISPAAPVASGRRVTQRRANDRSPDDARQDAHSGEAGHPPPANAVAAAPQARAEPPRSRLDSFAAFAAQLMGQGGQKRGLRGGPETLDHARAAYLETEWSGPSDRRVRVGRITRTEI